jgi:hypothetical protein
VWDTGHGIPASKQKAVFREFQRLDQGARAARGLGLGLSIVERIGRVLDHPITLRSQPARGSVFAVTVPIAAPLPAMASQRATAPRPSAPLSGMAVLCIDNEPSILPQIKSGKVRALAVAGPQRSAALPDVPTLEEAGYKGFIVEPWFGFMAPKGTPKAMIERLNAAFNRAIQNPRIRKKLEDVGLRPVGGPPERLAEQIRLDLLRGARRHDHAHARHGATRLLFAALVAAGARRRREGLDVGLEARERGRIFERRHVDEQHHALCRDRHLSRRGPHDLGQRLGRRRTLSSDSEIGRRQE